MPYKKYKDALPEETVARIKKLYKEKLNLELHLSVSERLDGVYSATLTDKNGGWNTCGKGTTASYCAASAYGESVEHLCNYFAYEIANLTSEANKACGFEKYPDEVLKDLSDIRNDLPDMLLDLREAYRLSTGNTASDEHIIDLWKKFLQRSNIPFVPYYSLKNKCYKYVPENMIFYLCGSNGGGAGNTPEEAIGHACDEIMERYVKFNIYMNKLTPPEVPRSYVEKRCPELACVINELEKNEGYKVIVKDASMGKGYSVMSVLMINYKTSEYLVNFGAHPKFEIALERCLTEMFQSFVPQQNNRRKKMEKWASVFQRRSSYPQNWVTILKDDSGVVPNEYFKTEPSWDFKPWPVYEEYSNKLGMNIQLHQLMSIAPDVYVHDASYLGFPTYRVYVPLVSTSHIPFDEFQLYCFQMMSKFSQKADTLDFTLSDIEEFEKTIFSEQTFVNGLIFRSLGESRFHLLHSAACYDIKDYNRAKEYAILSRSKYSEAIVRKINLIAEGYSECDIRELISLFFDADIADCLNGWNAQGAFVTILKILKNKGVSFSPRLFMDSSQVKAVNELHIALKNVMAKSELSTNMNTLFENVER